jgi:hypothetical protein
LTLLAPGVAFKQVHSCNVTEDGASIFLWLEMNDGSIRASHFVISELVERAFEIAGAEHAPTHATPQ